MVHRGHDCAALESDRATSGLSSLRAGWVTSKAVEGPLLLALSHGIRRSR